MKKIAKFEKVSFENFKSAFESDFPQFADVKAIYDNIKLPKRATTGSAGYDFFTPCDITLAPGETVKIPARVAVKGKAGSKLKEALN